MSRSFHVGTTPSAHRRRTDLMPTIVMTPANRTALRVDDGSRSSTPGQKMLRSKTTGRVQSMPRLDHLARPRVLVIPHETSQSVTTPTRNRFHNRGISAGITKQSSITGTPTKSVSMVQLNGTPSPRERKVLKTKPTATGPSGKVQ
jgi:hypothetical protein